MNQNFNLGTWNVVRSCLLYMSARPSVVSQFSPFIVEYVRAAQSQLLARGWMPSSTSNTLCTQNDQSHPHGGTVPGGGHCIVRYPDWMWILQEMIDSRHELGLTAQDEAAIFEHMQAVGTWGADFTTAYARPCDAASNRTGLPNCFPKQACNSYRLRPRPHCTQVEQQLDYFTHVRRRVRKPRCTELT